MNDPIHIHDVVALLEDTEGRHFETRRPIRLRRGQMGTVVMTYDEPVYEVEFSDANGRAFAMLPLPAEKLMVLKEEPEMAAT